MYSSRGMANYISEMYNNIKNFYLRSEFYELAQESIPLLNNPRFTLKDLQQMIPDMTHRKINDWDNKGLISGSRNNEKSGWRRFSTLDVLKLCIISDLRKFGFDTRTLKKVMDIISKGIVIPKTGESTTGEKKEFLHLEFFYIMSITGSKITLILDNYGNVYFLPEAALIECPVFHHYTTPPLLILPFFTYVLTVAEALKFQIDVDERSTFNFLLNHLASEQGRNILNLIKDKDYQSITITKPDGDKLTVKAKRHERGSFSLEDVEKAITNKDYQKVELSRVGGKIVTVTREETIIV